MRGDQLHNVSVWVKGRKIVVTTHAVQRYYRRVLKQPCPKTITDAIRKSVVKYCLDDPDAGGIFEIIDGQTMLVTVFKPGKRMNRKNRCRDSNRE